MGNILSLRCGGNPDKQTCVDYKGCPNCIRIENMKMVFCENLVAKVKTGDD